MIKLMFKRQKKNIDFSALLADLQQQHLTEQVEGSFSKINNLIEKHVQLKANLNERDVADWFQEFAFTAQEKIDFFKELEKLDIIIVKELPPTDLEKAIDYINDNIRFGSQVHESQIAEWFEKFTLNEQEKMLIYEELEGLKISIQKKEIKKNNSSSDLFDSMCQKSSQPTDSSSNVFDDFDDLDTLLSNEEFIKEVDSLENALDKKFNQTYLNEVNSLDFLKREKAIENLVRANEKLVWKVVTNFSKFSTTSFDTDDMFQSGRLGLLIAIEKFDSTKGVQFSTYAINWIRQKISRAIDDESTLIRIPVHMRDTLKRYIKCENEIWNSKGKMPTLNELANSMNPRNTSRQ